jgi:heme/copper-type cytochrome/quinol oxidase subunit 2
LVSRNNALIIIAVVIITGVLVIYSPSIIGSRASDDTKQTCSSPPGYITIIADRTGLNGSVNHGAPKTPWPVVTVNKGDTVNLFICNLDPVETHGFAIDNYFDGGVALRPGDTFKLSFVADKVGKFTIFCNIFCTIHVFMVGQLIVT